MCDPEDAIEANGVCVSPQIVSARPAVGPSRPHPSAPAGSCPAGPWQSRWWKSEMISSSGCAMSLTTCMQLMQQSGATLKWRTTNPSHSMVQIKGWLAGDLTSSSAIQEHKCMRLQIHQKQQGHSDQACCDALLICRFKLKLVA